MTYFVIREDHDGLLSLVGKHKDFGESMLLAADYIATLKNSDIPCTQPVTLWFAEAKAQMSLTSVPDGKDSVRVESIKMVKSL